MSLTAATPNEAPKDCPLCPRLVKLRRRNALERPDWFNGAAPSFGDPQAKLAVVGLAPGLHGANKTGRLFIGDGSGDLLYEVMAQNGFTKNPALSHEDEQFELSGALIVNAVRCAPPQNKPTASEINACRPFLAARLRDCPDLKVILALGKVAYDSTLRAYGQKPSQTPFKHGAQIPVAPPEGRKVTLVGSYHCSRYNLNTRRLTPQMFRDIFASIQTLLQEA